MSDLAGVKAGDTVLLYRNHHDKAPRAYTVLRVTPTGRIVVGEPGSEWVFNPDGYERGSSGQWFRAHIEATTPEAIAAAAAETERRDLVARFDGMRWHELPLDTLRAVAAALAKDNSQ